MLEEFIQGVPEKKHPFEITNSMMNYKSKRLEGQQNQPPIFGSAVSLGLDSAAVSIFVVILVELTNIETAVLSTLACFLPIQAIG